MTKIRRGAAIGALLCLAGAALLGHHGRAAEESPAAAGPTPPTILPSGSPDAPYQDPEAVVRHFIAELAKLAEKDAAVTPTELAHQADDATASPVATTPDPGVDLRPEEVFRRAARSVMIVGGISKQAKSHGHRAYCAAGFVLSPDGAIATNYHVVSGFQAMKTVGVMDVEGRVYPIERVLAADKHGDVAVIKVQAAGLTPLPLAADVPVGAAVFCLSHPVLNSNKTENAFYAFSRGIVSGKYRLRIADGDPVDVLTVTADYAVGSSGGPILNQHGAAVGMVCQTLPIFSDDYQTDVQMIWKFGRPIRTVRALLKEPQGKP